jgi:hypothetical protein
VVEGAAAALPYVVVDAADREIDSVSRYLPDLQLGDASPLTCRSYGHDLLGVVPAASLHLAIPKPTEE